MTSSDAEDDHSRSLSPYESGAEEGEDMAEQPDGKENGANQNGNRTASNAKDASRPRRKKARRACYACQRAHLTCGDERPCQRCIKRGLQDACQDGVRKKAKYLHDAPSEALMPGVGVDLFNQPSGPRNNLAMQNAESTQPQPGHFLQHSQAFNPFPQSRQMPPPMMQENVVNPTAYAQQSPVASSYNMSAQRVPTPGLPQPSSESAAGMPANWSGPLFDPSDPALFNFDLASMNFGNHYGALEFGMLGHMATGAGETPPSDSARSISHDGPNQYPIPLGSFSENGTTQTPFVYNESIMSEWPQSQNLYGQQQFQRQSEIPHAYVIETNPGNFTSPDSVSSPPGAMHHKYEESSTPLTSPAFRSPTVTSAPNSNHPGSQQHVHSRHQSQISTPQLKARSQLPARSAKRPRDPSQIYTSVTSPYSYTSGFHSLIAYFQRRFAASPSKTLTIAKSLASIRPSFIATTKTLNRDDLIFMEKCFQRTLWEYEGFIEGVGTPTIVARRTGEVAAVGKEFSILTGWKKDVLLGREPNLNVNRGGATGTNSAAPGSGANTTGRGTGVNTPNQRQLSGGGDADGNGAEEKRLQPVFLAELLDDDSVVEFYEGFARLAFGDSRGSVMGRGKLLKYKTKDDHVAQSLKTEEGHNAGGGASGEGKPTTAKEASSHNPEAPTVGLKRMSSSTAKRQGELKKEGISGEKGMEKLGFKDGKVECTYCWTVKRDVFDIPMLIVMNFLPCI